MPRKVNHFMFLLMAVAVVISSAIGTTTVYADDGGGAVDSSEAVLPVDEITPPEAEAEPVTVAEVLEQLPAGTELVAVNDAGEIEPLVTEAAAEIIATGDPMWCPSTPAAGGCTASFTTFADLIAELASGAYVGSGVIWVENTYNGNDDAQIAFDGSSLTQLTDLTIRGGWDGGAAGNISGVSLTDVSMVFLNWTGNIQIENMDIVAGDGAAATFGLGIATDGDITLNNVSVNNTAGSGDGAKLSNSTGSGNVSISNSEFNDNLGGNGLLVESGGTITLNTVEASGNGLTGASLENCLYASGSCAGADLVTITSGTANQFNDNGFDGLVVDAGGGVAADHVQANNNGLNGTVLTSVDTGNIGDVTVTQSEFNLNANGTGLDIVSDGDINLTDITASGNKAGATLDTTDGTGSITVNASNPSTSDFTNNDGTGLHAESGAAITLENVIASDNGTNGAYLDAAGNITVSNSVFNNNVHFNFPADPGLYANSNGGNITLTNVIADGNVFGAGAVLTTNNNGAINVTGGYFNTNGTFGVQAKSQNGNITLEGIVASYNKVKGAYLAAYGLGNIFVNNSSFVENGSYGIYASVNKGDITLDTVTVTGDDGVGVGDDLTDYGAVLIAENGGDVFVSDSAFTLNTKFGLKIVSSGQVSLVNVLADQNGGNGVEVYSNYTDGCLCSGEVPSSTTVSVDGGTFTNNGGYGLQVLPGSGGNMVFVDPPTSALMTVFGGNSLGNFLLDPAFTPKPCEACACGECCNPGTETPKDPNIIDVPFTGGEPVRPDYEHFSGTILRLPNGSSIQVNYPFAGLSNLEGLLEKNLPGKLGAGTKFVDGINVSLTDEDGNETTDGSGTIIITFKVPKDSHGKYSVLFWDPTLNAGKGGWVQMPLFEAGTSFPLDPNNPEDGRTVLSGVQQIGDTITLTVNFPGIFVLTTR